MAVLILWMAISVITIITSTFIHEIGHGLSCYLSGISVSTGFNKIGDVHKKPSQSNFRDEQSSYGNLIWDLGVPFTLTLALSFTYFLSLVESRNLILIIGSVAYYNSLARMLPCCNALFGLVSSGKLNLEDEVGLGVSIKNKIKIPLIDYLPLLISLIVSIYTLNKTLVLLVNKAGWLFEINRLFIITTVVIIFISSKILNYLDERYRINWIITSKGDVS